MLWWPCRSWWPWASWWRSRPREEGLNESEFPAAHYAAEAGEDRAAQRASLGSSPAWSRKRRAHDWGACGRWRGPCLDLHQRRGSEPSSPNQRPGCCRGELDGRRSPPFQAGHREGPARSGTLARARRLLQDDGGPNPVQASTQTHAVRRLLGAAELGGAGSRAQPSVLPLVGEAHTPDCKNRLLPSRERNASRPRDLPQKAHPRLGVHRLLRVCSQPSRLGARDEGGN